jgi:adenylate kinase
MRIILLGPPGVGKGTEANLISQNYIIPHISTGDLLRQALKDNSEIGKKAKNYMDKGLLVPNEIVVSLLSERVKQKDCEKGFVLDGFPRNIKQAEILEKKYIKTDKVLALEADTAVLIERLSGRRQCKNCDTIFHLKNNPPAKPGICDKCSGQIYQRDDDKEKTIKKRLEVYNKNTLPLINYYQERNILYRIDANGNAEEIFGLIKKYL